jgi:hypothetical protein
MGRIGLVGVLGATLAAALGGCELLVGITDKSIASDAGFEANASGTASDDTGVDGDARLVTSSQDGAGGLDAFSEASGADGESDANGGNARDTASETSSPDAGSVTDPDLPCSQQNSFLYCNDFDSVTSLSQTWDWLFFTLDGGSFALDGVDYVSPPKSAQTVAPAMTGNAQLGKDVGNLFTGFRVAFDLRVDMNSLQGIPQIGVAQALAKGPAVQINYILGPGSNSVLQVYAGSDGGGPTNIALPLPTLRKWTRVVFAYDANQGISVLEDGRLLGANTSLARGAPGDTVIIVGNVFVGSGGSATTTTELDNVVVSGH